MMPTTMGMAPRMSACRVPLTLRLAPPLLEDVEGQEEEDPDDVDEVPVVVDRFDGDVVTARELARPRPARG